MGDQDRGDFFRSATGGFDAFFEGAAGKTRLDQQQGGSRRDERGVSGTPRAEDAKTDFGCQTDTTLPVSGTRVIRRQQARPTRREAASLAPGRETGQRPTPRCCGSAVGTPQPVVARHPLPGTRADTRYGLVASAALPPRMRDPEPQRAAPARRALLSVSRKEGLDEFARGLAKRGFEIVASGGTARCLEGAGVPVVPVSEVTGHPEILDGRVKTLHPRIHGGILARRSRPEDLASLAALGIRPVDVVAVNFYPFEETVARGAGDSEVRENIDIGGPCLVRAAAKNWPEVAVVVDPADYPAVLAALDDADPTVGRELRRRLAGRAFAATSAYEAAIAAAFTAGGDEPAFPERISLDFERVAELRYGENPHQMAALYREPGARRSGIPGARQLHGKELSYNNILDLDAAVRLVADLADGSATAGTGTRRPP